MNCKEDDGLTDLLRRGESRSEEIQKKSNFDQSLFSLILRQENIQLRTSYEKAEDNQLENNNLEE